MINKTILPPIYILFIIFLTSCDVSKPLSPTEQALQIRLSINNNNLKTFRSLSTLPMMVNEQEWESAKDGTGFVLGASKQITLSTDVAFNETMPAFLKSVQIEGVKATTDITLNMFRTELGKHMPAWINLKPVVFKRGEGDVEHIVLMGLSKDTHKLKAIYFN